MPQKRRVKYSARPKSRLERVVDSLKPANLKAYWFSREGAVMAGKIAGGGFLALFLLFLFFAKDLPSPGKINSLIGAQTTRFYDREEKTVLYEVHGDINRTVIGFDQMPENIKKATIAVEDKDFYRHGAFSVAGIARAVYVNIFDRGNGIQGGSTITQQYVKKALLSDQRTLTRKIKEVILSMEIEAFYSKNDILKLYLNEIPYSTQAYGVQAASKTYFDKDAKDLTLDEAAFLAAIPRNPNYYSPYGNNVDKLLERKNIILNLMAEQGYITKSQADEAKKVDVMGKIPKIPRTYANVTAPYFVKHVELQLSEEYGSQVVDSGGLKVITTLDLSKQKQAEEAVKKNMANVRSLGGSNAAIVAANPKNGEVVAWVGGHDFSQTQVDVASAQRQPGSSFKPFVYATLFGKKTGSTWGPGSTIYDVTTDFGGGYKPHNYCLCNYGVVSIRQAIGSSLNIPAVKALYLAGIPESIKTAKDLGITTLNNKPSDYGLSLVLGSGEVKLSDMVSAYGGFAAAGNHVDQVTVLKIVDAKGKTIKDNTKPQTPKRVLDEQVAYEISNVMSDRTARSLTFGANFSPLIVPGRTTAVKTGTTENFRDAWTIGYTQSLVAGVWTGNNDGKNMSGSSGAVAAPIWKDFMVAATKDMPDEPFKAPSGIKQVTLDAETGRIANDKSKTKRTDIFASWYKPVEASQSKSAQVDKLSGKLATECTPPLAIETVYSTDIHAEIPPSDIAYSRCEPPVQALAAKLGFKQGGNLPTEKDDKHSCSDDKPSVNVSATADGPTIHITATVNPGTFDANKLEIYFDDQIISTQSPITSNPYVFDYQATSLGGHTIKAVVTDSGYYQDEDSDDVTVTSLEADFEALSPKGASPTGLITFSWTPMAGASSYKLYIKRNNINYTVPYPLTSASTSRQVTIISGNYKWFVEAYDAGNNKLDTTPQVSFNA